MSNKKDSQEPVVERCTTRVRHCSQCGSTDWEDVQSGYSACCNEPVVSDPRWCHGHIAW